MVTLEWVASPINDMYADAVLSAVLQADSIDTPKYIPSSAKVDKIHFKECLIEMLQGREFEYLYRCECPNVWFFTSLIGHLIVIKTVKPISWNLKMFVIQPVGVD